MYEWSVTEITVTTELEAAKLVRFAGYLLGQLVGLNCSQPRPVEVFLGFCYEVDCWVVGT